jgi:hypothetical protein
MIPVRTARAMPVPHSAILIHLHSDRKFPLERRLFPEPREKPGALADSIAGSGRLIESRCHSDKDLST